MRRAAPQIEWVGRTVRARDGEAVGTVLRAHDAGEDGWPETIVVDRGDHNLALPAIGTVLTRVEVRLPWSAQRLAEARPLDAEAQDDPAAVARAAAAFEDPSRVPIGEDSNAMTLSEERLDVRVEAVPTERVVLRKRLVEEHVSVPVTVRREVVEMVREPVTEDAPAVDAPGAVSAGDAAEIVLYEERPVVGVEVVPRERIRLVKQFETDEVAIADSVRREEPAVDRLPPTDAA
jgi:uncharacterized protein (TIGR02271 family)